MRICNIESRYGVFNKNWYSSTKKNLTSRMNRFTEKIKQNAPIPPKNPKDWKDGIQKIAKKLSDGMMKFFDTL